MSIVIGSGTGTNGITIGGSLGTSNQIIYSNNGICSWSSIPSGTTVFTVDSSVSNTTPYTTVDLNLVSSSTRSYLVTFSFTCSNPGSFLNLRFGNGSGYQSTNYEYDTVGFTNSSSNSFIGIRATSQSSILFPDSANIGCSTMSGAINGYFLIHTPGISSTNSRPLITGKYYLVLNGNTNVHGADILGWVNNTLSVDRLRFFMSSGNITSHKITSWSIDNTL